MFILCLSGILLYEIFISLNVIPFSCMLLIDLNIFSVTVCVTLFLKIASPIPADDSMLVDPECGSNRIMFFDGFNMCFPLNAFSIVSMMSFEEKCGFGIALMSKSNGSCFVFSLLRIKYVSSSGLYSVFLNHIFLMMKFALIFSSISIVFGTMHGIPSVSSLCDPRMPV